MSSELNKRKRTGPDEFERELFAALEPTENDVARAADSPFLSRRLMVAIAAEEDRRNDHSRVWHLSFGIALRAIPGLAAVTLAFVCAFLLSARTDRAKVPVPTTTHRVEDSAAMAGGMPLIMNEDVVSVMLGLRSPEPRGGQ